jgi:hypothetical protein
VDTSLDSDAALISLVKLPNTAAPEVVWDQTGAASNVINAKQTDRTTFSLINRTTFGRVTSKVQQRV